MRILVTGGAGYIGSVVTEELLKDGHQVVVFDNLTKGHRAAVVSGAEFVEADLHDSSVVRQTLIPTRAVWGWFKSLLHRHPFSPPARFAREV